MGAVKEKPEQKDGAGMWRIQEEQINRGKKENTRQKLKINLTVQRALGK